MKATTKIMLGAAAVIGGVAAGVAINKALDNLVNTHLGRDSIQHPKTKLMSKKNQEDFANSPEAILGQLFYASTPQINITIPNREGRHINALLYKKDAEESKYAIVVHGYRSTTKAVSYLARRYFEAGYNVLVPYLRAHHGSDYEYCTMGWHERFDIIDWINYIIEKDHEAKIILHGASMGAATVMNATGEELPDNVICCIEDCGFTTLWEQYSVQMSGMFKFPPEILLNIVNPVVKAKLGFNLKDNSPIEQVKKSKTPTLFIHGDKDTVVPFWMNYPLYQSANCEKERLVVEGATHAAAGYVYPEIYWDTITKFIDKHM